MRPVIFTIILATASSTVAMNGMMIPLTERRSSWLKPDNSVDFDALHSHVKSVDAKILRGLENYERNTGTTHSLAVKGMELLNVEERAVGATALTNHDNFAWYGTIAVGTPPKPFTVDIDTGSSDIFLPGPTCPSCSNDAARWDPTASLTSKSKGSTFTIKFTDGATASGNQYTDNVTIAGLSADIQTIGAATTLSGDMGYPPDGMLGMAFQSISKYPASPLFETLVDEGKVTEPVFSVKIASNGGELYLGGTNGDLYEGEIIYTPVTVLGYWQVNIQKIRGNGQTILGDIAAVIDTGSNVIVGDRSQVANLHRTLGGKRFRNGFYTFPCNGFPKISFDFGGDRAFEIPVSVLNRGPVEAGSPDCFSTIVGRGKLAHWDLGAVFLQSVYTVFDFGNKRVGFANLV